MEVFLTENEAARVCAAPPPDFRPFGNRVLLKFIPPETSGVILPDSIDQRSLGNWARVIAVGPGVERPDGTWQTIKIPIGAKVLLPAHQVVGVTINDEHWIVCYEQELMGQLGEPELTEQAFRADVLAQLAHDMVKRVAPELLPPSPEPATE